MSLSSLSGGSTACAACKYQRKKCTKDCVLAPYFPQDRPKQFLNSHKLFGVSNITKMIKKVDESQRDIAMQNLIFHANARALDPVGGVYRIVCDLKRKIECCQAELNFTLQQIAMFRSLAQQEQRQRQDLPFGCHSYGGLLEQGDECINVDGYDYLQNMQQEERRISDQEQKHLLRQILMSPSTN
ncbi:hypothetical protein CARUB_v10021744mg [Capsella rubella]|uniref:LOB domain-containing protein n=1 Tax=Capsella rubella TaxID=81985 RepID=R0GEJ3_9BRAS|nr:LOB domain-containing protein 7 [Capsella rubella]EOA34232.1 hypothetical protein CARUB_v10021744mg [Capsella rubella]